MLAAGRTGLSSAESRSLMSDPDLRGPSALGSPQHPSCRGLQVLSEGPDLRFFPFTTGACPRGSLRGFLSCLLTPTPTLAGRGRQPGGFALQHGPHRKLGVIGPPAPSPPVVDEPDTLGGGLRSAPGQVPPGPCPLSLTGADPTLSLPQKAPRLYVLSWAGC